VRRLEAYWKNDKERARKKRSSKNIFMLRYAARACAKNQQKTPLFRKEDFDMNTHMPKTASHRRLVGISGQHFTLLLHFHTSFLAPTKSSGKK
jgi:hypothetical protein